MMKRPVFIEEKRRPRAWRRRGGPAAVVAHRYVGCHPSSLPGWLLLALLFPQTRFTRGSQRFSRPASIFASSYPPRYYKYARCTPSDGGG